MLVGTKTADRPCPRVSPAEGVSRRVLANEWAAHGITVNAVAPGYVETNSTRALREDPERREAILARIPMGRWARPSDIAGAVTWLARCPPRAARRGGPP